MVLPAVPGWYFREANRMYILIIYISFNASWTAITISYYSLQKALCCPNPGGAFKRTVVPNRYMHVVCAMFIKSVDHNKEPYVVNMDEIGKKVG